MGTDLMRPAPLTTAPTPPEPIAGEERLQQMHRDAEDAATQLDSDAALLRAQAEQLEQRAADNRRHAQAYWLALDYLRSGR